MTLNTTYRCVTVILLLNGCDVYRIIDQPFGGRQKCRNDKCDEGT